MHGRFNDVAAGSTAKTKGDRKQLARLSIFRADSRFTCHTFRKGYTTLFLVWRNIGSCFRCNPHRFNSNALPQLLGRMVNRRLKNYEGVAYA